jgi:DNA-binding MarR family transcriptional regulator
MPHLLLKDLPRYECLLEAAKLYPALDPSACEALLTLLRTGDETAAVIERELGEHGISHGRFGVLMLLWQDCEPGEFKVGLTPAELADKAGVTRATMTGLVDTLERDSLVRREADPEDRRMMRVVLTAKAKNFLEKILPGHFRVIAELMQPLTEAERKTLARLLNKILQHTAVRETAPAVSAR